MKERIGRFLGFLMLALTLGGCASDGDDVQAPQVSLDVRGEETYRVGEDIIRVHITATDPQGLDLSFAIVDPPERSTFQTFANSAVFTWDPITSDVTGEEPRRLVFVVENSRGVSTERVVLVRIQPGNTVPRFQNSSSELYNPSTGQPMTVQVRARDDDSPQVILSMPAERAPQGASFEQVDNFEGRFRWMPSPVQLESRMHTVTFVADDGENDPVEHEVTIIIQNLTPTGPGPGGGGGGAAPSCEEVEGFEHQPLEAQRTSRDYVIEGRIVDASQAWDEAVVYYTLGDPLGEGVFSSQALSVTGDQFEGVIPNPLLSSGESEVISYQICAFAGAEYLCSSWDFLYRFVAYSPDDQKCRDDGLDYSSPQKAGPIEEYWGDYRSCAGVPKYFARTIESGEAFDVFFAFSPGQAPEIEVHLSDEPLAVELFDCLGFGYVEVREGGNLEVRVEGDDSAFHVLGLTEAPQCGGDTSLEPNDTPAQAILVMEDFEFFEGIGMCVDGQLDLFAVELVRGDVFAAFLDFVHAEADLDFTLFAPSQVEEILAEGSLGVAQGWSISDTETLEHQAVESGFYYLKVENREGATSYDLAVERACEVDGDYTDNFTQFDALFLGLDEEESIKLCEGQSAWFWLEHQGIESGFWLGEVTASYGSLSGLEVRLVDDWGQVLDIGEFLGGYIDFSYAPEPGETLYLELVSTRAMVVNLTVLDFSEG